tara:strand:+ start:6101 stop:6877 length:777 start_codon:yes stop_codon:yes gene_type:complete
MTYAPELDDHRQEVRRGYASNVIRYWPKYPNVGNVTVTGTPTYSLYSPTDPETALASGSVTVVNVSGSGDRLEITVDASDATTWALDEHYAAVITWTYSGVAHRTTLRFDCVLEPWSLDIALNDYQDELADAASWLLTLAESKAASRTAAEEASVIAVRAWSDVRRWIKAKLEAQGAVYPRLIADRVAIRRVVIAQALFRMFKSFGRGADTAELAEEWRDEAGARFRGMGPLAYDSDEDGAADTTLGGWGVVTAVRAW